MKRIMPLGIAFILTTACVLAWRGFPFSDAPESVAQPLAFSHQRHLEEEIGCLDCHAQADDGPHATYPTIKTCLLCHEEAVGNHPDEPRIREFAGRNRNIPWIQVNRVAGHVYFSHVAHVRFGKMDCRRCHGDMRDLTETVSLARVVHWDMRRCMDCHEETDASMDCLACHK